MDSKDIMRKFSEKKNKTIQITKDKLCYSRINSLLDEGSFVELSSLVKPRGLSDLFDRPPVDGDGVVTGYGTVDGKLIYIASSDPDVYGGSLGQMHARKISLALAGAVEAEVPFVMLIDSGGARIEEGILALEGLSELLSELSFASEVIPVINAILGPCAGGSAIAAALGHFNFMTKENSRVFMNGPMVTAAKEGKEIDTKEIGGFEVHSQTTGFTSFVSEDEKSCMDDIKNLITYFPDSDGYFFDENNDDPNRTEIRLDDIASSITDEYSMEEIISLVFDNNSVLEVSKDYCKTAITSLAKMDGFPVGVIATGEKRLSAKSARKLADFVDTCSLLQLPLVSFVDCEGFAIGLEHEHSNIIQEVARLFRQIEAYPGPKIAIIVGKAVGTAYLTLAGKNSGFDFVYAWPTAQISVVNSDTAANILYKSEIAQADDVISSRQDFTNKYEREVADPKTAAAFGYVDEIIYPSSTRPRLASAFQIL